MEIRTIWMSPDTARKSRWGLRTLGGIAGIAALMGLLIIGGTLLAFALDLPREAFSLLLVCAVTALAAARALKLGWRSVGDATVFFLTRDDRLYVMDARTVSRWGRGIPGYISGALETQRSLRALADASRVPDGADEILQVSGIRENRGYYAIRCRVRRASRQTVPHTCFLVKGYADQDALLQQLERRQRWDGPPEPAGSRDLLGILISALVLTAFAALCVLSHPAVDRLPRSIYFPCLGAAFLTAFFLTYFIIRHRRGE